MSERIVIIIQCAGSKNSKCGFFRKDEKDEKKVIFVADPDSSPEEGDVIFAHPDDNITEDKPLTYREDLVQYNENRRNKNPYDLCEALSLYKPSIYQQLKNLNNNIPVYILSAGWGLVRGSFLLPYYDITFSSNSRIDKYKRREDDKIDFHDFNHLKEDWRNLNLNEYNIYVFVTKNYLDLFYKLMGEIDGIGKNQITIFHLSDHIKKEKKFNYQLYKENSQRTNWHYSALKKFLLEKKLIRNLKS